MHDQMHEIQPLMHLLSSYVIKPIAFDANPYVLPRAAQFVKYGGANKYFQKHGNKPQFAGKEGGNFSGEVQEGTDQFRRPKTAHPPQEAKDSGAAEQVIDDFETVGEKPKKVVRAPYKKLAPDAAVAGTSKPDSDSRKTSDVGAAPRKASDASGPIQRKISDAAAPSQTTSQQQTIKPEKSAPIQRPQTAATKDVKQKGKKAATEPKPKAAAAPEESKKKAVVVEEPKVEEPAQEEIKLNADGQPVKKIKGPKPRGLTKFKPMVIEQASANLKEEELSEN